MDDTVLVVADTVVLAVDGGRTRGDWQRRAGCIFTIGPSRTTCAAVVEETQSDRMGVFQPLRTRREGREIIAGCMTHSPSEEGDHPCAFDGLYKATLVFSICHSSGRGLNKRKRQTTDLCRERSIFCSPAQSRLEESLSNPYCHEF